MAQISAAEAAERLGVSKRRILARIEDGSLPAERVGNQWAINPADAVPGKPSRPMSNAMAWALVAHLAGDSPAWVSAGERYRLKERSARLIAAEDPAALLRGWLSRRARRLKMQVAAADLPDLRQDQRLLLSGVSAPGSGIVAEGVVEGYVSPADFDGLVNEFFLIDADGRNGNVVLHVVDEIPDSNVLHQSWALLAADLAEHSGARERGRVVELLRGAVTE